MSTHNTQTPPAAHIRSVAQSDSSTVPESEGFRDAILSNPLLLITLRTQEIVQLKHVCKSWENCYAHGSRTIANARQQDDSRDWYFPVVVNDTPPTPSTGNYSLPLSGIWHKCADHASEQLHSLPPLSHLPPIWSTNLDYPPYNGIIAGSGGLLLMNTMPGVAPAHRSSRLEALNPQAADSNYHICALSSSRDECMREQSNWERLMVCNPLTKEFRELPAVDATVTSWNYFRSVQAHLVVDDKAANSSYRVILTFLAYVCVYNSTSNSWKSLRFPEPSPLGRNPIFHSPWADVCASIYWRGRLLFADIEFTQLTTFRLRIFEIDFEAGEWNSHNRDIPPQIRRHNFDHCPLRDIQHVYDYTDGRILPDLELVECMGEIYAVTPARLDQSLEIFALYAELEYMPLQFYIFQLQLLNLVHGALRIQLPRSTSDIRSRRDCLSRIVCEEYGLRHRHWFRCTASGSVIWVSFQDYLLQYDVVSEQSKTQIIPVNWNDVDKLLRFSYRPSFHMKP